METLLVLVLKRELQCWRERTKWGGTIHWLRIDDWPTVTLSLIKSSLFSSAKTWRGHQQRGAHTEIQTTS